MLRYQKNYKKYGFEFKLYFGMKHVTKKNKLCESEILFYKPKAKGLKSFYFYLLTCFVFFVCISTQKNIDTAIKLHPLCVNLFVFKKRLWVELAVTIDITFEFHLLSTIIPQASLHCFKTLILILNFRICL